MGKMDKIFEESKKHLNGEEVVNWIPASYETKTGVLVATTNQVVFYGKKLFGYNLESIPYSKISSVDVNKSMNLYHLKLFTSGNDISIMSIDKKTVEFAQEIRNKIA